MHREKKGGEIAWHFLRDDYTSSCGDEPPWKVGKTRTIQGTIAICEKGYHASPSWYSALSYADGSIACIVQLSSISGYDTDKMVGRTRKLIAAKSIACELRLFACDCAERALLRERERGQEPDSRSWNALEVATRYANGQATKEELAAAREAAWDVARYISRNTASNMARTASWEAAFNAACNADQEAARRAAAAAARNAAWAATFKAKGKPVKDTVWKAAWHAEIEWQKHRLDEYLTAVFQAGGTG